MLLEYLALITGAALVLIYVSTLLILGEKRTPLTLVAAGLLFLGAGLSIAAEGLQISSGIKEYSYYWNCSALRGNCSGTPANNACLAYTQAQCYAIPNCTWVGGDQPYCSGTPSISCAWIGAYSPLGTKCLETDGCTWSSDLVDGTCDQVIVNNTYLNMTGNWTGTIDNADLLTAVYIFTGLFFILWGAANIYENRDELEEDEEGL